MSKLSYLQPRKRSFRDTGWATALIVVGVILGVAVVIALNLAFIIAAIIALVWGITDTVQSGVNFWSIAWIVIGALGALVWLPTVRAEVKR